MKRSPVQPEEYQTNSHTSCLIFFPGNWLQHNARSVHGSDTHLFWIDIMGFSVCGIFVTLFERQHWWNCLVKYVCICRDFTTWCIHTYRPKPPKIYLIYVAQCKNWNISFSIGNTDFLATLALWIFATCCPSLTMCFLYILSICIYQMKVCANYTN